MKRIQRLLLPLLGAATLWTTGCDRTHVVAGGSDDTHSSLRIQGRVLTQDAKALPNVVVRLRHLGLSDTTGTDGSFFLAQETGFESGRKDTLDYFRDGESISSVAVPTSVWTAPDVYVIQRDFSGTISGNTFRIRHVEGELKLPDGTIRKVEMDWNESQRRYSGFSTFSNTQKVDSFSILVLAKDSLDRICGKSDTLRFTSRSGSVLIPLFDAQNGLPSLAIAIMSEREGIELSSIDFTNGNRTPYAAWTGDSVRVVARIEGMLNLVDHAEWSLDRTNWHSASARRVLGTPWTRWDTVFQISPTKSPTDTQVAIVKLVMKNGLQLLDSVRILPRSFLPYASILVGFPPAYENLEGVPPGAPLDIILESDPLPYSKVVSRKVTLGRSLPNSFRPGFNRIDLIGPVQNVRSKDTILTAPTTPGAYAYVFQIEHANGITLTDTSSSFLVLNPAPRIESMEIKGDSISIRWSDSVPSSATTRLRFASEPYGSSWQHDSLIVPAKKTTGSFRLPIGCRSLSISVDHPYSFRKDTSITIPHFTWTFSGATIDTTRLKAWGEGIGGFRAYAEGGIAQILFGEVARLRWYREDSTDLDGGAIHLKSPTDIWNVYDSSLVSDTLSFDIASPSSMDLAVEAPFFCQDDRSERPKGIIRWTLPQGATGKVHLALSATQWPSFLGTRGPESLKVCWTNNFTITATQTTGARERQGFLEVDNVLWH